MYSNYGINKPSFMVNTTSSGFGASTSTFGQPVQTNPMFPSMQPPNLFQTPATSSFSAGPSTQTGFGTSNIFGQTQPSSSGLFGGGANAFGQNKSSFGFGQTAAQPTLFGQQQQQAATSTLFGQTGGGNLFGGGTNAFGSPAASQATGTVVKFAPVTGSDTMQKNGVTTPISTKHHCITCMKEYETKSLEELRFEDYSANRKGPQQQGGFAPAFGGTTVNTATPLFGAGDAKPAGAFGQTTGFGQSNTFGQNTSVTPSFGMGTGAQNSTTLFGKPAATGGFGSPATSTTAPTFGFNQSLATATGTAGSNPFGGAAGQQNKSAFPQQQQPLFGGAAGAQQQQTAFGSPAGGVFGQTAGAGGVASSNLFQKPQQAGTAGAGGFSFNAQPGAQTQSLFPAVSKPNNTGFGLFGQPGGTATFGQAGQNSFGANTFGKTTTGFGQTGQTTFGTNLGGGMAQPQTTNLFGNTAPKTTGLFGNNTTTGGGLFNTSFQQPTNTFNFNNTTQQQGQPNSELSESVLFELPNFSSNTFLDRVPTNGLDPFDGVSKMINASTNTTNPTQLRNVLETSRQRDTIVIGNPTKIKVESPKTNGKVRIFPVSNSSSTEFFENGTKVQGSRKALTLTRNFESGQVNLFNKYRSGLLDEAEDFLKSSSELSLGSVSSLSSPRLEPYELKEAKASVDISEALRREIDLDSLPSPNESSCKIPTQTNSDDSLLGTPLSLSSSSSSSSLTTNPSVDKLPAIADNPAGVILTKAEYYMIPSTDELHNYMNEDGRCIVDTLTIGRRGYGNVYYSEPVDVTGINLDQVFYIRHREVVVYPSDETKPPIGEGLNKPAQITLDRIYPKAKDLSGYITDVDKINASNFVNSLMSVTTKHKCQFVDYRPKTGSWVFRVQHFSKYGLTDSDDEELYVEPQKKILKQMEVVEGESMNGLNGIDIIKHLGYGKERIEMEEFPKGPDNGYTNFNSKLDIHLIPVPATNGLIKALPEFTFEGDGELEYEEVHDIQVARPPVFLFKSAFNPLASRKGPRRIFADVSFLKNHEFRVGWDRDGTMFNPVSTSLDCSAFIVDPDSNYNVMMPDIEDVLDIALEQSVFSYDTKLIPTLNISDNHLPYLRRQAQLFTNHVKRHSLIGKETYMCAVWSLCHALWGSKKPDFKSRSQNLSDWLTTFAAELSDEWQPSLVSHFDVSNMFDTIFHLLSFHRVKQATEYASSNGLHSLSLLLSQLNSNTTTRKWNHKYIEGHAWDEKNVIENACRKIFLLLSGVAVHRDINVTENFDWLRCLGTLLWYVCPNGTSISSVFKKFEEIKKNKTGTKPTPIYNPQKGDKCDILYHILNLYVDGNVLLSELLDPNTHTDNPMDCTMSWLLLQLFTSLKIGLIDESTKRLLTITFASRLESLGHWKWAIFALLYLKNNTIKKNQIMSILTKNLEVRGTERAEFDLVESLRIPNEWIHEVKATKAKMCDMPFEYVQEHMLTRNSKQAIPIFLSDILPSLFINEQYDYLATYVNRLDEMEGDKRPRAKDWVIKGGLFQDFLKLQREIMSNKFLVSNSDVVRTAMRELVAMGMRIHQFKITNEAQQLCIAELSRRCALLFRHIFDHKENVPYQDKYAEVLEKLVMPPDYHQWETFSLVQRFTGRSE